MTTNAILRRMLIDFKNVVKPQSKVGELLLCLLRVQVGVHNYDEFVRYGEQAEFQETCKQLLEDEGFSSYMVQVSASQSLSMKDLEITMYGFLISSYHASHYEPNLSDLRRDHPVEMPLYEEVIEILSRYICSNVTARLPVDWNDYRSNFKQSYLSALLICSAIDAKVYFAESIYLDLRRMMKHDGPCLLNFVIAIVNKDRGCISRAKNAENTLEDSLEGENDIDDLLADISEFGSVSALFEEIV